MADDITSIGSGKTYADPTAWEADSYGSQAGNDAIGQVYGSVADCATLDDTTPASIVLEAEPTAERHDGTAGTGAKLYADTFNYVLIIATTVPTEVRWLEIDAAASNSGGVSISTAASSGRHQVHHSILYQSAVSINKPCFAITVAAYVYRCVLYSMDQIGVSIPATISVDVLNCTIYGMGDHGFTAWAGATATLRNCAITDSTNANVENADTNQTPYNTNGNAATNYEDHTTGDFRLTADASGLIDQGTDISGSYSLTDLDVGIDGTTNVGSWDIGADVYVAAAAGYNTIFNLSPGTADNDIWEVAP